MTVLQSSSSTTNKVLGHPLNAWYVAAWDHEVTRKPMARRIADRPLALYRTEDGKAVALADACWHRLAPLSMGKTVGKDEIQCPYHGIRLQLGGPVRLDAGAGDHQPVSAPCRPSPWWSATGLCGFGWATPPRRTRTFPGHAPDGQPGLGR